MMFAPIASGLVITAAPPPPPQPLTPRRAASSAGGPCVSQRSNAIEQENNPEEVAGSWWSAVGQVDEQNNEQIYIQPFRSSLSLPTSCTAGPPPFPRRLLANPTHTHHTHTYTTTTTATTSRETLTVCVAFIFNEKTSCQGSREMEALIYSGSWTVDILEIHPTKTQFQSSVDSDIFIFTL